MMNQDRSINSRKEESVEQLLDKLAKKGKRVKLLDESGSVRELPRREDAEDDDDFSRDNRARLGVIPESGEESARRIKEKDEQTRMLQKQ